MADHKMMFVVFVLVVTDVTAYVYDSSSVSSDDYSPLSNIGPRDATYNTPETFYIWIDQHNKGLSGILMVAVGSGLMGHVCQQGSSRYNYQDYTITQETANKICQHLTLNFHFAGMINKTLSYNSYSSFFYRYYDLIRSLTSRVLNVHLDHDQIKYTAVTSCDDRDDYSYISCGCDADYFVTSTTCMKCPAGSSSPTNSTICHCPPGQHWFQGYCKECPENTYSLANSTECSNCPKGSYSKPESDICYCDNGLQMTSDNWSNTCTSCPSNHYSYNWSNTCTRCPDGTVNDTSNVYQGFCVCPEGLYWDFNRTVVDKPDNRTQAGYCRPCSPNTYSSNPNSTDCRPCPEHSVAGSGASMCRCGAGFKWIENGTCAMCLENYFSKAGSLECTRCPHFKTSAAGSEYCYRCTLGQYWKDHQCLECPEELYGDGVNCNKCPEGFKVSKGFCYKDTIVLEPEGHVAEVRDVQQSSSLSYLGAVATSLLVMFGYIKRNRIKKVLSCVVPVKKEVEGGVNLYTYSDLRSGEGPPGEEVDKEEEKRRDKEEKDRDSGDDDVVEIQEENLYEDI